MADDSFYITLPSNASMDIFPENTPSNWITALKDPIQVPEDYEVGLSEIHIPRNWNNIKSDDCAFDVEYAKLNRLELEQLVLADRQVSPLIGGSPGHVVQIGGDPATGEYFYIDFVFDLNRRYKRSEYFFLLERIFETELKDKASGKLGYQNDIVVDMKAMSKGPGALTVVFEILFKNGWAMIYDADLTENDHIPLARLFALFPAQMFEIFDGTVRVLNRDDWGHEDKEEYSVHLTGHRLYVFNLKALPDPNAFFVKSYKRVITLEAVKKRCKIPAGFYSTNEHLISAIMNEIPSECHRSLHLDINDAGYLRIYSFNYMYFNIKLGALGLSLGLNEMESQSKLPGRGGINFEYSGVFIGKFPVDVNRSVCGFFVYCDLIRQEYVGDQKVNLLRVVPTNFENMQMHNYSNETHYKPLSVRYITKIHMLIKTDADEEVEFVNGKSLCKLHFRKIKK
jgi:hypothetical protein